MALLLLAPTLALCLEGVEQVMISQQVVEGSAGPLYMYAARAGGTRAT
jgi:hypothetical protein